MQGWLSRRTPSDTSPLINTGHQSSSSSFNLDQSKVAVNRYMLDLNVKSNASLIALAALLCFAGYLSHISEQPRTQSSRSFAKSKLANVNPSNDGCWQDMPPHWFEYETPVLWLTMIAQASSCPNTSSRLIVIIITSYPPRMPALPVSSQASPAHHTSGSFSRLKLTPRSKWFWAHGWKVWCRIL